MYATDVLSGHQRPPPPTKHYIPRWLAIFFLLGAKAHYSVFIFSSHDTYYDYYYNILLLYTYVPTYLHNMLYRWVRYYNWRPNESVRVLVGRRWVRFVTFCSVSKTFVQSMLQNVLAVTARLYNNIPTSRTALIALRTYAFVLGKLYDNELLETNRIVSIIVICFFFRVKRKILHSTTYRVTACC